MKNFVLAALPLALAAGGCATITRGSHQTFTVESEPAGAEVATSTGLHCEATPCTFARVDRNTEFDVTVSMSGYKTWTGHVTHHMSGSGVAGMAGNVLIGGVIGAIVDTSSGATQDLAPNPLHVALEAEADTPVAATTTAAAATPGATATATATPASATAATTPATAPAAGATPAAAPASPH